MHASFLASGGTRNPWCSLACGLLTGEVLSLVFPQGLYALILLLSLIQDSE